MGGAGVSPPGGPGGYGDRSVDARLLASLWCPDDHGDLLAEGGAARCASCGRGFPYRDGVLSFVEAEVLDDVTRREQSSRDAEAAWYDTINTEYTNAVELPAMVERLGLPVGPILDHGAGTGRITAALARQLAQPVIALDYSHESLRLLVGHCKGLDVLAVHADGRALPIRDGVIAAATSAEVYEHFRAPDRRMVADELARVLRPGAPMTISTLNYSWVFRLWRLVGNKAAKQGEHLFGSDFFYVRQTPAEFRAELDPVFVVRELVGIRNIPARTLAGALGRVIGRPRGERLLDWMARRGHRADRALEGSRLSHLTGTFLLALVERRA
ncbi:MAG: methyltransferase domain-containing protein [Acidimicrobiia bacterium]|nr:methyltransferase domain-containing protein [Acidimicrobiia bacterium]